MSLAAFPHPNERHATPPLRKQHSQAHGNAVLGEKPPKNNARKGCFGKKSTKNNARKHGPFPKHPLQTPSEWASNFESNPYRPSEWSSNFENNPRRPSEWSSNLKNSPYRPSEWASNFENTLADPLNGHQISKTPLLTARKQVFHGKQRKTFQPFGSASSPHGMQQKAGCRETRSTAACLYIEGPSAFNLTILHSRSPADGADWRSWDTCAHSS